MPARDEHPREHADGYRHRCGGASGYRREPVTKRLPPLSLPRPVYVRGLAYSQLGRFNEAAAEFQTIVDHPGLVLNDPIGPMARLQLARALRAEDRARSAQVYTNILALWKDADPDNPVLKQAKAESARLQ